ncbi:MAG: TonB-dependent receptor [bacterium]
MRVVGRQASDPTAADTVLVLDDDPRFAPGIAESLELAAGATVRRAGTTSLLLRGAGGHQVRVFLDDVPLDDGRGLAIDLDRLPASALEAIRVRRGAAGALHGSGAQGGVIELRTHRRPVRRLRLRLGAFGDRRVDATLGAQAGPANLLAAFGAHTADGDFSYVDTNGQPRVRGNNRRTGLDGLARLRAPLGARGGLTALVAVGTGARGEPGLEQFEQADARSVADQSLVGVGFTTDAPPACPRRGGPGLGPAPALRLLRSRPAFAGAAQRFTLDDTARERASSWSLGPATRSSPPWPWSCGTKASTRTVGGDRDGRRDEARLGVAATATAAWRPAEALTAQAALRVDDTDGRAALLVPAAGLEWRPWPVLALRGNVGRLFRDPGFDELYFEASGLRGDPDLRPEDGLGGDLGAVFFFEDGYLSLTAFRQRYDRLILFVPVNAWLIQATDDARAAADGLELEVVGQVGPIEGRGAALLQRTRLDDAAPLPFRPAVAGALQLGLPVGPGSVFATYRAQTRVTTDGFGYRTLPARHLLDVGVSVRAGPWRAGVEVTNCLDDRRTQDAVQQPLPGRAWHLGLAFAP